MQEIKWKRIALHSIIVLLVICYSSNALPPTAKSEYQSVKVGTKSAEPFAIKNSDGTWSGISIDLWKEIAGELNLSYELIETDQNGLLEGLKNGQFDLVVAAMTITAEREEQFDFTHPFHTTGLAIAVSPENKKSWTAIVGSFFSWKFFKIVVGLFFLLLLIGTVVWFFERKKNKEQFGGTALEGIGSGLWWSAVTMTTVGYGDKAPTTFAGRIVGLIWMFTTLIIISSFTAAITSVVTISQLENKISSVDDLHYAKVGTIAGTNPTEVLRDMNIDFKGFGSVLEGLAAVSKGELDAFVYDAPILKYHANKSFHNSIYILPQIFKRQDYGIALTNGFKLREQLNQLILKKTQSAEWEKTLEKYLGK